MTHELTVRALGVRYGGAVALRGIDLDVPGGVVTALVGPNGAGKSSALLAVYGSVASTGSITVDGDEVRSLSATQRARRGIAIVPQGRQLFPRLTVRENLQVMAEVLKVRGDPVEQALHRFPILAERARSLAGVLSGGEQQMLVVSRALLAQPRVILLDEMTTGLAPQVVTRLADLVRDLAQSGVAVLVAEPAIGALRRVIDRGYVLRRGEIVAEAADVSDLDRGLQAAVGGEIGRAVGG